MFIGSQYYHCFFFFPPMQNLFHSANPSHSLTIYIYIYTHLLTLTLSPHLPQFLFLSFFSFFLLLYFFLNMQGPPSLYPTITIIQVSEKTHFSTTSLLRPLSLSLSDSLFLLFSFFLFRSSQLFSSLLDIVLLRRRFSLFM